MKVTLSDMGDTCAGCGTKLAETGAPIWESYCPNDACTYERDQLFASVRQNVAARDKRNRLIEELIALLALQPTLGKTRHDVIVAFDNGDDADDFLEILMELSEGGANGEKIAP